MLVGLIDIEHMRSNQIFVANMLVILQFTNREIPS